MSRLLGVSLLGLSAFTFGSSVLPGLILGAPLSSSVEPEHPAPVQYVPAPYAPAPYAPVQHAYGFGSLKQLMIGLDPILDIPRPVLIPSGLTPPRPAPVAAPGALPIVTPAVPITPATPGLSWPMHSTTALPAPTTGIPSDSSDISNNSWQRAFSQPSSPGLRPASGQNAGQSWARGTQARNFPSFASRPLDDQLRRYLNYLEAVGPADIFIVGSARAVQGVDPLVLEQALAERGYGDLRVFNWGVNGTTAQVVDLLLREILTPEQLPKLVVWADGSRSFSSGRRDRTYENIKRSAGYRALSAGQRPFLSRADRQQLNPLRLALTTASPKLPDDLKTKLNVQVSRQPAQPFRRFFIDWCSDMQGPCDRGQSVKTVALEGSLDARSTTYLEASGFQINSRQFVPQFYFQQHKKIAGAHDGDYKNFSLFGDQHRALKRIMALSEREKMPIVFLSMPLTQTYLDPVRRKREAAFVTYMQAAAKQRNLSFYDFSRLWPNRNDFFFDPSHVNRYGAAAVSWQFAKRMNPTLLKQISAAAP